MIAIDVLLIMAKNSSTGRMYDHETILKLMSNTKGIAIDTPPILYHNVHDVYTDLEAHVSDTGQSLLSNFLNGSHTDPSQSSLFQQIHPEKAMVDNWLCT